MLDVGFSELLVFGIIALLVLGPDKLPEAARFAARCYSKFKTLISNVQNDIDRELRLSELREQMNAEMNRIQALEQKMQAQMQELQQQTIHAAEQQQQHAATDNKNSTFVYRYISTPHTLLFLVSTRTECDQFNSIQSSNTPYRPVATESAYAPLNPNTQDALTAEEIARSENANNLALEVPPEQQKESNYKVAV